MERRKPVYTKKKKILTAILLTAACTVLFGAGMAVGASTGEPGSSGDPLITQSYLEAELAGQNSGGYSRVTLEKGQELRGNAGTQVVLYSGNAGVAGSNGLINLTGGEFYKQGFTMPKYQLCLVPEDGQGLKAESSAVVFVQGSYSVD